MPYYHVYICYYDKNREKNQMLYYDLSEGSVNEKIAIPYMENKKFFVGGRVYNPAEIDEVIVLESECRFDELRLYGKSSPVGVSIGYFIDCFANNGVKGLYARTHKFIHAPPREKEEMKSVSEWTARSRKESEQRMTECAAFMGLDDNWFSATSALQLQEVAVTLVAQKKGITLSRESVERILSKRVENLSFNEQYEAFSKHVKDVSGIEMPILTAHLRKMRAMVLHQGYNPKPEETKPLVDFTVGLLQKLKSISDRT
jgi:hypothetical protein